MRLTERSTLVLLVLLLAACGRSDTRPTTSPLAVEPRATACIQDPDEHARAAIRVALAGEEAARDPGSSWTFGEEPLGDLDGDGTEDVALVEAYHGTATNVHLLYLSNRGCRRFAGSLWVSSLERLPTRHEGVQDLRAWSKDGCAGREGTVQDHGWNGAAFVEVGAPIRCECPDTAPDEVRAEACP